MTNRQATADRIAELERVIQEDGVQIAELVAKLERAEAAIAILREPVAEAPATTLIVAKAIATEMHGPNSWEFLRPFEREEAERCAMAAMTVVRSSVRCRDCDGYNCDSGCAYPDAIRSLASPAQMGET